MTASSGRAWQRLLEAVRRQGSAHLVLIDPDRVTPERAASLAGECDDAGADAILFGSSTPLTRDPTAVLHGIRRSTRLPVILFPGGADQLHRDLDAVLFLSLLSGRDPRFLIEEQLRAAPRVLEWGLESIPTAYLLVGSADQSAVARVTGTAPIPADRPDLVVAHAQAAACLGMSLIYLEGGSGSRTTLPPELVRAAVLATALPVAVGGGVREPADAAALAAAGAQFVVTGTVHEQGRSVRPFTEAVHGAAVQI